jgi:hypothetical protein
VAGRFATTGDIYRGIVPFVSIQVLCIALVMAIPATATWLPDQLFGAAAIERAVRPSPAPNASNGGIPDADPVQGPTFDALFGPEPGGSANPSPLFDSLFPPADNPAPGGAEPQPSHRPKP